MKPSGSKGKPHPSIDRDVIEFWRERYIHAYSQMSELREDVARLRHQLDELIEHQKRVDKYVARLELKARKRRPERLENRNAHDRTSRKTSNG